MLLAFLSAQLIQLLVGGRERCRSLENGKLNYSGRTLRLVYWYQAPIETLPTTFSLQRNRLSGREFSFVSQTLIAVKTITVYIRYRDSLFTEPLNGTVMHSRI